MAQRKRKGATEEHSSPHRVRLICGAAVPRSYRDGWKAGRRVN